MHWVHPKVLFELLNLLYIKADLIYESEHSLECISQALNQEQKAHYLPKI